MGELHIEIIHDRIRREYGIETHLGPLQVAYRETILHEASATGTHFSQLVSQVMAQGEILLLHEFSCLSYNADTLDRAVGERRHVVTVELAVRPVDIFSSGGSCQFAVTEELGAQLPAEMKEALENGVHCSYLQGSIDLSSFLLLQPFLYFQMVLCKR